MSHLRPQRTIARPVSVAGFGYWSGEANCLEFLPAPVGTGIVFSRQPSTGQPLEIPAVLASRVPATRRTNLSSCGASVEMVEHVLAALSGLAIDNCRVVASADEMPACDGSAATFVACLERAGIIEQSAAALPLVVTKALRCEHTDGSWIEARPTRRGMLTVKYHLDYPHEPQIGQQEFELDLTPTDFVRHVSAARTFVLEREANAIRQQGKGSRVTPRDLLIFGEHGPIDNMLRYSNECVRHKVLDVIGDLSLAGQPIIAHVVAHRSGHELNAQLVEQVLAHFGHAAARRSA